MLSNEEKILLRNNQLYCSQFLHGNVRNEKKRIDKMTIHSNSFLPHMFCVV